MYESVSKFRHAPPALFDELKKPVHYQKNATAWFFDKVGSGSRWLLSNMAGKMPIYWPLDKIDKNLWNSSEQLYQSSKYGSEVSCLPANAKSKKNPYVRQRIRADNTPRGAKATQKCAENKGLVRKGWADAETEVRIQAMLWVLELKLYWNQSTFGEKLMATGNLPIVEISTKDDFWGCKEVSAGCLVGLNVLGKLLMDVRSRMDMVKRGQFTYPNGWLLP